MCERPTEVSDRGDPGEDAALSVNHFGHAEIVEDRYIVTFRDRGGDLSARAADVLHGTGGQVRSLYRRVLGGFSATIPREAVEQVRRHPAVLRVNPDIRLTGVDAAGALSARATSPGTAPTLSAASVASWGLARINQRAYDDEVFDPPVSGDGVGIWILDTGIRWDHSEFVAFRVDTTNRFDAFRDSSDVWYGAGCWEQGDPPNGNGEEPGDTIWDNYNTLPYGGHGTHTAGTAAGGSFGVATSATLYTVRVADCHAQTTTSRLVDGLESISARMSGPTVVNMSLSFSVAHFDSLYWPSIDDFEDAVKDLVNQDGAVFVTSAGNTGDDACDFTPNRLSQVITVAGSDEDDERWDEGGQGTVSNFGSCVDLFAPGANITSAHVTSTNADLTESGTSSAAPHVAGIAALFLEDRPTASPGQVRDSILALATADSLDSGTLGSGSPNLLAFTPRVLGASITGPDTAVAGSNEWDSNPAGGVFEYAFLWEMRWQVSSLWDSVGAEEALELQLSESQPDFVLRVTVGSGAQQKVDTLAVVGPCHESPLGCPEFVAGSGAHPLHPPNRRDP